MTEEMIEQAYQMLNEYPKVTPLLVMRRLGINADMANAVCARVWLRQHLEARKLAKEIIGS
jgi:predicted protein tyrosine phosphatase